MSEAQLHMDCVEYLKWAFPDVFYHHSPNQTGATDAKELARRGAMLKRMGSKAGFPDLLFLWNGKAAGIELKYAKGTLSDAQKEIRLAFQRQNIPYAVARSVDELRGRLKAWGFPCKEEVRTNLGTKLKAFEWQRPL